MGDLYAHQAEIADLSRRLSVIESLFLGHESQPVSHRHLVSLYWDACTKLSIDETSARHWDRQLSRICVQGLLVLARAVRDPTPWHPLVVVADRFVEDGFDLESTRQQLLQAAQELLNLQGLRKIAPRDIMGNPLRVKAALSAISSRGLHGAKRTKTNDRT